MYFLILILIFQISFEKKFIDSEGHSYGAYLSVPSSDSLKFLMGANTNNVDDNWDSQKISKLAGKNFLRKHSQKKVMIVKFKI